MSSPYRFLHKVAFEETNLVGNVYFAHYVRWQGHCREQFLYDHAPDVVRLLQTGELAMVTVNVQVEFLDECFAGDDVEILMRQAEPSRGGHRLTMEFTYRRQNAVVALGKQTVACMRRGSAGEPLIPDVPPKELLEALGRFSS
ncbi:acyl-CoA thioesterase [Streptomyces sp. SID13031]|uniref:acyl-CoA thioesterase n=1 Tax=Streptomyces sp. SID13031 TaxID=2706046 RepID=UPI0013CC6FD2|nr:acyl-CoA thioesterase [Streptomyces sp. SID13031]NEA33603.1 acyl-CoA thioesterase [Streptomyces sp. SID13031]